jgi:hypothetical protein
MMKPRISKDYIDGCRSFVDFAVLNCRTPDGLIYCPCKACCLNKRHNPALVFDHLTGGKGMSPQYKEWIYHGEPPVRTQVAETNLPRSAVDVGPSTEDVGGNMQALLRDLFGVHCNTPSPLRLGLSLFFFYHKIFAKIHKVYQSN